MKINHSDQMIDITSPDIECEVTVLPSIEGQGISVWVNVDGICRLRVTHVDPAKLIVNYQPSKIVATWLDLSLSPPEKI